MVDDQLKSVTSATRLSGIHRQPSISLHLRGSRRSGGSLARTYKLAQYYRVIPCLYSEQIFCYAACLLKWFRLEAMRQEALSVANIKSHHSERHTTPIGPTLSMADVQSQKGVEMAPNEYARIASDVFKESHNVDDYTAPPSVIPTQLGSDMEPKATTPMGESTVEKKQRKSSSESDGDRTSPALANEQRTVPDRPIYGVVNKSILTRITYGNSRERRDTYRLVFGAMKYNAIIEKLLDEITFYLEYPDLKDEEHLVLVLVYDYTIRNFQRRVPLPDERQLPTLERYMEYLPSGRLVLYPPGNEIFKMVEEAVQAMCMRLAAAVARVRVRNQVGSLRLLLPEEWRSSEQMAEVMPTYGWYNQLLGKQDIVTGWLKDHGFRRIMAGRSPQPLEYASDKHCSDVFIFNKADVSNLLDSEIVQQKNLVLQDKSSCLGVHYCLANIAGGEEVMFVNCINVYSAVHMEGLIGNKFPLIQPVPQIRCVRATKEDEDVRLAAKMGSKVIRTTNEEFLSIEPGNERNKTIRHIYIEASDSRSGVVNPVGFLEVELDDLNMLRDMWTPSGNTTKDNRRNEFIQRTSNLLKHALKFSGIRTVTLLSHSEDIEETDGLVLRVAEATNRLLLREAEMLAATSRNVSTGTAFNPQIPTFVGLQEEREAFEAGKPSIIMKNKTIRVKPSQDSNGFFIATLHKEQILLKSGDDLRSDIEQPGKGSKDAKGRGKAKKR